jgi:sec-independent protein translocase protein TatA
MFGLGLGELVLIMLIALIFIGPKKLPELAKNLGKGIRDFQDATRGFKDEMNKTKEDVVATVVEHNESNATTSVAAEEIEKKSETASQSGPV